jgi:DNA-directed RNA polymerase specialized sigma24 family protein
MLDETKVNCRAVACRSPSPGSREQVPCSRGGTRSTACPIARVVPRLFVSWRQAREKKQILHAAYPMDSSVHGAPKRYVQDDTQVRCWRRLWRLRGRNARVIDFEKALDTLDTAHQLALLLTYRDRQGHAATAAAIGCSVRTSRTCCPADRRRQADVPDRRDLL